MLAVLRTGVLGLALGALALTSSTAPAAEPVTFSEQIVRIFQAQCQECHRPGGVSPFALTSYLEAYPWRQHILEATKTGKMPPWKPVAGYGEFRDARRLSPEDRELIARWVAAGAPEGDPARLPPPKQFPSSWALGEPDVVLDLGAAYTVPGRAADIYRCFPIPTGFPEDRYVAAVEVMPGNRKIVHHVLTFLDTSGASEELDRAEPGPGYTCFGGPGFASVGGLGGWAPGAQPHTLPPAVGLLLPARARVVVQMHYNNHGDQDETDRTRIGLHFAKGPIDKRVRIIPVLNTTFTIPAGAARHEVRASWTVPSGWDLHALAISPHMHLLGREMKVTATYANGTTRPLIYIDDWDFNWQGSYTFVEPVPLPGGTRIDVVSVYDNSATSPRRSPGPITDVGWGDGTQDEMCIAFLRVTVDRERLNRR
jgi:mono/diheme cytochrome c family protein